MILRLMNILISALCSPLLTVALSSEVALAEEKILTNINEAKRAISGTQQRVWIEETVVASLSADGCKEGVRYRFRADNSMTKESCVDGAWKIIHKPWSLAENKDGLLVMALGERSYIATLVRRADSFELAILDLPSQKIADTRSIVLRYRVD